MASKGDHDKHYYARAGHPALTAVEHVLTVMEAGGTLHQEYFSSLAFSSGMAAISAVLETLARESGERSGVVLHGRVMYPLTKDLLKTPPYIATSRIGAYSGIEVPTVDNDLDALEKRIKWLQRDSIQIIGLMYEPVANPTLDVTPTSEIARLAHQYDIPVIVDNTFLTPYLNEPLREGADIVVHSMTKYMSGEGDVLGGCVTGPQDFMAALKETRTIKGGVMAPQIARVYAEDRLRTLPERMDTHTRNACDISIALNDIAGIKVLGSDRLVPNFRGGFRGGVVSFVFDGSDVQAAERSYRMAEYLSTHPGPVRQATSLGEPQTLVLPYAGQLGLESCERLRAGHVPPGLVRIAVGRESKSKIGDVCEYLKTTINATF